MAFVGDKGIASTAQRNLGAKGCDSLRNQRLGEGDDLDRKWELPEMRDLLAGIADEDESPRSGCDNFFAQQRAATAFDQIQLRIDFVGAINVDVELRVLIERGQRDSQLLGELLGFLRSGNADNLQAVADAVAEETNRPT